MAVILLVAAAVPAAPALRSSGGSALAAGDLAPVGDAVVASGLPDAGSSNTVSQLIWDLLGSWN